MTEDVFLASPRKAPSNRRSTASLRGPSSLAGASDAGDDATNGRYSLAHELAVAMMPEPSAGSKLLAEEFGIEFDEGAEGIDDPAGGGGGGGPHINVHDADPELSFAESDRQLDDASFDDGPPEPPDFGVDPTFGSPSAPSRKSREAPRPAQDAMEVLAQDLESTDKFLSHLRRLDVDSSSSTSASATTTTTISQQPALERLASEVIRRINETARDREGQLRELLECEREFRRIAGEVGGQDVLGRLDALPAVPEDEDEDGPTQLRSIPEDAPAPASSSPTAPTRPAHLRAMSQDWETDPDVDRLGDTDPAYDHDGRDDEEGSEPPVSPSHAQVSFSSTLGTGTAPPSTSSASRSRGPAGQLADLRGLTTSLVASLTSVSEHAQVNGAATAEAGRKIRALRNRLGGWRTEWEGAERSRGRIERWEAGEAWESSGGGGAGSGESTPVGTPARVGGGASKRVDGRKVVQEHLHAFELALADAAVKTNAIMAS